MPRFGRQFFSAPAERGARTASACSPLPGGSFFQHRPSGVLEPRTRFTLSGWQPFSLNLSGELRSAERGDSPRPAAGQEGRHQGFYPLNSHFLLGESGADCRHVTAAKRGTAEDFFFRVFLNLFAVSDTLLLHRSATSSRRGITVPRNIFTCADYPDPAVIADLHSQTVCAARLCRACGE